MKRNKISCLLQIIGMLLPVFVYFTFNFHNPTQSDFWAFMADFSPFPFVQEVFDEITTLIFGNVFNFNSYLAYIFGVEIFILITDFVLFIPRWIRDFIVGEKKNGKK